jgi:hypothetical protein
VEDARRDSGHVDCIDAWQTCSTPEEPMNRLVITVSSAAVFALVAACGSTTQGEGEEPQGETSSKLEGSDGCFIINPACALGNGVIPDWTQDGFGADPGLCMARAHDWSIWCGNTDGVPTGARFDVGGNRVLDSAFSAPPTRCLISQPVCARFPGQAAGTWGDDYMGSGSDPNACLARSAAWSLWCGNPPGVPTRAVFERPSAGVHLEVTYVAH